MSDEALNPNLPDQSPKTTTAAPANSAAGPTPSTQPTPRTLPWPAVIEGLLVLAACLVVLWSLGIADLLADAPLFGTDNTGHPAVMWVVANDFLPGSLGGWSESGFAGYPINILYPPFPTIVMAITSYTLPFFTAYKLIAFAPLFLAPLAAYFAGRLAALPRPLPIFMALAAVPFVYDTGCSVCGGNIGATVNGEFAHAWAITLGLLALGFVDRLCRTGDGLIVTALVTAAAALSHPAHAIWIALGVITLVALHRVGSTPRIAKAVGISAAIAAALALAWWLPFLLLRDWMPVLGFGKQTNFVYWLFPASPIWEITITATAITGVVFAVLRRRPFVIMLAVLTVGAVLLFIAIPEGLQLYNARLLPMWQLGRWLLAGIGLAELTLLVAAQLAARKRPRRARIVALASPLVALAVITVVIGSTWGWWGVTQAPTINAEGQGAIGPISYPVTPVAATPTWLFTTVTSRPDYPERVKVEELMRSVAKSKGCGRLAWDQSAAEGEKSEPFGDALTFLQVGMWTDGCIRPINGILNDSSATSPSIVRQSGLWSQGALPLVPTVAMPKYQIFDGISAMQQLGVRYYLTHGGAPEQDATRIANTPVNGKTLLSLAKAEGDWKVWTVSDSDIAQALPNTPAVLAPPISDGDWDALGLAYTESPSAFETLLAQSGPASWPRVEISTLPTKTPVDEPVGVAQIKLGDGQVSFTVTKPGQPVLVKVSAFPGWKVEGADGPYRVSPNLLVVVPTDVVVTLTRERTTIEWVGIGLGVAGLLGIALVLRYRWILMRERQAAAKAKAKKTQAQPKVTS